MKKEGVYPKYIVFRHPDFIPEQVVARAWPSGGTHINEFEELDMVEDFIFALKPSTDHHARVALAAYAASCQAENPQLTRDLLDALAFQEKP